jgi:hypothetical protein
MHVPIRPQDGVVPVIFSNREDAEAAVAELHDLGFAFSETGALVRDPDHHYLIDDSLHESLKGFERGALKGAPLGAAAGMALAALAVPGIGTVGVAGALLFGAPLGALWGVIAGGYLGMTGEVHHLEEIEQQYDVPLKPDEVLVMVVPDHKRVETVCTVMQRHGARCADQDVFHAA